MSGKNYITIEQATELSSTKDREAIDTMRQEIKGKITELEQLFHKEKLHYIQALGIFVTVFTFLAVNVQIFTKLQTLSSAIIFMLVMAGISIVMLLVIEVLINSRRAWGKLMFLAILAILEIAMGIFLTYKQDIVFYANTDQIVHVDARIKSDNSGNFRINSTSNSSTKN